MEVSQFHNMKEAIELQEFNEIISKHLFTASLIRTWPTEVQAICYNRAKKKQIPTESTSPRSFLNCVAALMTRQLQELLLQSMEDYTQMITQHPVRHWGKF